MLIKLLLGTSALKKKNYMYAYSKTHSQDSPGGPVSKTLRSQCRGAGFNP